MRGNAIVLIPISCSESLKDSLAAFIAQSYPWIIFDLRRDANIDEPTLTSLEAREGAFGFIEGNSDTAAQAQMAGIQDEISWEYRRLRDLTCHD
jgi:hypothetical protein